ncbi:hypothetical protein [Rhodococcoides fascians]|uniref:hypothetical protein n=1 Tax=Rhodococcoides fascians TaxID=1828 RepID=UPI0005617AB4|nr:hypothetical protein [Rhodococcus fascians]
MTEVPTFVKGEPGFTAKLNQLADAVRELQKADEKPAVKRTARAKAETKPADAEPVGGLSE